MSAPVDLAGQLRQLQAAARAATAPGQAVVVDLFLRADGSWACFCTLLGLATFRVGMSSAGGSRFAEDAISLVEDQLTAWTASRR